MDIDFYSFNDYPFVLDLLEQLNSYFTDTSKKEKNLSDLEELIQKKFQLLKSLLSQNSSEWYKIFLNLSSNIMLYDYFNGQKDSKSKEEVTDIGIQVNPSDLLNKSQFESKTIEMIMHEISFTISNQTECKNQITDAQKKEDSSNSDVLKALVTYGQRIK